MNTSSEHTTALSPEPTDGVGLARIPRKPLGYLLAQAIGDLADGLSRWRLWWAFAWEEIKTTYRRSYFGAFWIALSFAAFVIVKLLIFIPIMRSTDTTYYSVYLLNGFFVWQFMVSIVNGAPAVFVSSEGWIKNDALPLSVYVYKTIAKALFSLVLTGAVVVAVMAFLRYPLDWHALLTIPAIALFVVNAGWVCFLLGVICTRHRDIGHFVQTFMRVMFFLTPIFWQPQQMGRLMDFLWWNPFSHFMWIFRTPLIDHEFAASSWIFVCVLTVAGWTLALFTFAIFRRRIVFWF